MLKVAVLVSGGGTNLQAIIDAIDNKVITDTEIVAVISNNRNAFALRITRIEPSSTRHFSQSFRRPELTL